jgi:predicted nucleic acid-binding Zn ribbon protein
VRKVGDVLREFLKERGWPAEDPYAPLFRGWEQIAGRELGSRSRVVEVEDGVVVVEVDHPGWLQMLLLRKRSLLDAARKAVPGGRIDDLRGRVSGSAGRRAPSGGGAPAR